MKGRFFRPDEGEVGQKGKGQKPKSTPFLNPGIRQNRVKENAKIKWGGLRPEEKKSRVSLRGKKKFLKFRPN